MKKSYVVKKYMLKIELNDTLTILQFKELFNQQIKQRLSSTWQSWSSGWSLWCIISWAYRPWEKTSWFYKTWFTNPKSW